MATSFFSPDSSGMSLCEAVQRHDRAKQQAQGGIQATKAGPANAPPGWDGSITRMQKRTDIKNPHALAWWMYARRLPPATHAEKADTSFDASIDQAVRLTKTYPLPKEYLAAARGENWAINMLLDPHAPPLIVEAW
ncbi:MAG TPA: hypothetical protein VI542_24595 [Candidatus Tectomicrobia bacterium]